MFSANAMLVGLFTGLGWTEVALILLAALLIFGNRLPNLGRDLARAMVGFRRGLREVQDEVMNAGEDDESSSPPAKRNDSEPTTKEDEANPYSTR